MIPNARAICFVLGLAAGLCLQAAAVRWLLERRLSQSPAYHNDFDRLVALAGTRRR